MHARFYNPLYARFLSIDPKLAARPAARRPQLWNRYSYVAGNPLKYLDPTGEVLRLVGDVKKALTDLRNTVPPEDRIFLRTATTKDGHVILDKRLLSSRAGSSGSENFQRIAGLADSSRTIELNTSRSTFVMANKDGSGTLVRFGGQSGVSGITLPEGQGSMVANVTQIFVAAGLTALTTAKATAEELTHADLFIHDKPYRHERTATGERDPYGFVNRYTAAAVAEAEGNYDPFIPPD